MAKEIDGKYKKDGHEVSEEMISLVMGSSNFASFRHDVANSVFVFDSETLCEMGLSTGELVSEASVLKEWGEGKFNYYIDQVNANFEKANYRFIIDFNKRGDIDSNLIFYVCIEVDSDGAMSAVEVLYSKEFYEKPQTSHYVYDGVNLRDIINNLDMLLFLVDRHCDIVEYNLFGEKFFGQLSSKLNKKIPLNQFLNFSDSVFMKMMNDEDQLRGDMFQMQDINNISYDYLFNTTLITSSSGSSYILFSGVDVTDRIKQQEQLMYNEMKYRTLVEQSPNGINLYDINKKRLSSNSALISILGDDRIDEIWGADLFDRIDISEKEFQKLEDGEVIKFVKEFDLSFINGLNNGTLNSDVKYLEITLTKIVSDEKNLDFGYFEIVVDKTDEYKAYRSLKRKTDQLYLATTAAKIGVYEVNLLDRSYIVSPEGFAMFEDDSITKSSPLNQVLDKVHPDDYADLLKNTSALKRGESKSFSMEYRIMVPGGKWKWIQTSCKVDEYNPAEGIISIVGINIDIDKIKIAEQNAHKREKLLRQTLKIGKIGFWQYDVSNNIISLGEDLIAALNLGYSTFNGRDFSFQQFLKIISSEDRRILEREYSKMINGFADSTSFDLRLSNKYNDKWINIIAHVNKRDEQGDPVSISGFIINIHEKASALEELKRTKYFLDSAISISKVGYIYEHYESNDLEISDSCCEIFGLSKNRIKRGDTFVKYIHNDDFEDYLEFLDKSAQANFVGTKSVVYRIMVNGNMRLMHEFSNIHFEKDKRLGTLYTIQDITELREKETQLQELLDNQRLLSEISIMIMATLDVEDMLNRLIHSVKDQFNADSIVFFEKQNDIFIRKGEVINIETSGMHSFVIADDYKWIIGKFKTRQSLFIDSANCEFPKFVEVFSVVGKNLFLIPVYTNKEFAGVIVMSIDDVDKCVQAFNSGFTHNLINLINIAFEKYYREAALIKAKNKAEEADSLKTAFLKNMSHEIRTPLNSIVGFANLMSEFTVDDEDFSEYANAVNRNSQQLLNIVNNVIDFSEIESNSVLVNMNYNSINDVCHDVFKRYFAISSDILKITYNIPEEDVYVYTDGLRIKQVLLSLIDNSIKYTNEGVVDFGFSIEKDKLLFYVSDTGIGIAEAEKEKLFERFYQADNMSSGTGLGLSIVKAIIEKLNGEIWFDSKLNSGTTFYFSIPIIESLCQLP